MKEVESTNQRLDKLPPEIWEKILDELEENDLFPLALSCRFFRQKQKELVARTGQSGPGRGKPRLALRTDLWRKLWDDQPASVEYLRFCSKENVPFNEKAESQIRCLAAFHGNLPLLQELLEPANELDPEITEAAGKYPFHSLFFFFFVLASDFLLAFSSSQRAEANWRPCSG